MPSLPEAKGTYQQPPSGQLSVCPHCNKVLDHHVAPPNGKPAIIRDNKRIINLFGGGSPEIQLRPTLDSPEVRAEDIASGDIFVAEPANVAMFEHVKTGQARPERQHTHAIPGMPRRDPPPQPTPAAPVAHPTAKGLEVLDNPILGGKMTICVLLYGEDHHALHRRCLNSICETVPPSRLDLRVACNQVGLETTNYLNSLPITKVYEDFKNRRKYPAMRAMFHDKADPITTKFVTWFDDDSYVLNKDWLSLLGQTIVAQRPADKVGMYGVIMRHPLKDKGNGDPRRWFRAAKWYRNRPFRDRRGTGTANGSNIQFIVGGFWAISTEAIQACDIPDERLNHNAGDITIGEQLWQGGYKMKLFNNNKCFIKTSGAPRRGFHEPFPHER